MVQASNEIIRYFQQAGTTHYYQKDQIIYLQGEYSPSLYLISRGRVRMFFIGKDGKEVTYRIIGERQLFGESVFLSHTARPATISAVTETTLISYEFRQLSVYLGQSKELSQVILSLLADNYQFLCRQVRRLSIYNRFQQIASYLLNQSEPGNDGIGVSKGILPYTHEELGVCLNLNRVTVTRVLNEFQKKGLVELERKRIRIINREGLKSYCDMI